MAPQSSHTSVSSKRASARVLGIAEQPRAKLEESLRASRDDLGVSTEQFSALTAIAHWRLLFETNLAARGNPLAQHAEAVRNYLRTLGFLPRDARVLRSALRSGQAVAPVADALMSEISANTLNVDTVLLTPPELFRMRFPALTNSHVRVLQSVLRHQQAIDRLDLSSLKAHFPYPISRFNFFGRFIAGGTDNPGAGAKHVKLTEPFFLRLKCLLEGIEAKPPRIAEVCFSSAQSGESAPGIGDASFKRTHLIEIIHQSINNSQDLLGQAGGPKYHVVATPSLPAISFGHIEPKERSRLTAQLFEWLLFGDASGDLLHRRGLTLTEERELAAAVRHAAKLKKLLCAHKRRRPSGKASDRAYRTWERAEERIENRLEKRHQDIRRLRKARQSATSILQKLNSDANLVRGIRKFRGEVQKARTRERKIVFSSLKQQGEDCELGFWAEWFDRAMTSKDISKSPACQLLRESAHILSNEAGAVIRQNKAPGIGIDRNHIEMGWPLSDLTPSLLYLTEGVVPKRADPKVFQFATLLAHTAKVPGAEVPDRLIKSAQAHYGTRALAPMQLLEFSIERAPTLERPEMMALLAGLRALGTNKVPERVIDVAMHRFHLSRSIFERFEAYGTTYHPQTLGDLPSLFEDLATLERYLGFGLESYGMKSEVEQLDHHLRTLGIVCLIDGTDYHPELVTKVEGETFKEQSELTGEIWGRYTRPQERVLRNLSRALIEGEVSPELRDHSLVGVLQPGKINKIREALARKFYGIDIGETPNLAQVRSVLESLSIHNDRSILVLDATQVRDLQQYREFMRTLKPYGLKVIIRAREAIPGIPQVVVEPLSKRQVVDRLEVDSSGLAGKLELTQPISRGVLEFTASQVHRLRRPNQDPLNLTLAVLHGAAEIARPQNGIVCEQDVTAALSPVFHLPDADRMRRRLSAVDEFVKEAPLQILGQRSGISIAMNRISAHLLGLRDPERPLSLLLVGPSGVGKTELMYGAALELNLPYFLIEGSQFGEAHTLSRLTGSPSGYVGPDEGILVKFLRENDVGIVFIDEIEKMHSAVYTGLMNFYDKGALTAGDGTVVSRPGMIIVAASNAGADQLHEGLSPAQIRELLAEYFVDPNGEKRPEIVRRFEPIPMLPISSDAFREVIRLNLKNLGSRYGFVSANLRLSGISDEAADILCASAQEVCRFEGKNRSGRIADIFAKGSIVLPEPGARDKFFDLRYVGTALQQLSGESLRKLAEDQYRSGASRRRGSPRFVKLERQGDSIVLVDAA